MKISTKIILAFFVMVALVAFVGLIAVGSQQALSTLAATREAAHVAHLLSTLAARDSKIPLAAVQQLIDKLHRDEGRDIVAVDARQVILADAVPEEVGTIFEHDPGDEVGLTIKDGKVRTFIEVSAPYPQGIKQIVVPIANGSNPPTGAVVLEYTPLFNELMQLTKGTMQNVILAGAFSLVAASGAAFWIQRSIADPLKKLTAAASRFAAGKTDFALPSGRTDEIGQLSAAFETMTEKRRKAENELRAARDELEARVAERTVALAKSNDALKMENEERRQVEENLRETQGHLLQISRQAGMAEVATNVLHNVGNVLNSVNVTSSCLADRLRKSRGRNLARVAELLRTHENNLGAFFTNDPQGRKLPEYLDTLAGHLDSEQEKALDEIGRLQTSVDHIKAIVIKQQGFAKMSAITETVAVGDLVEDALMMNLSAFTRHEVEIVREFEAGISITVDRHMAIQILVNLLRNGKDACKESAGREKRLICRTSSAGRRVRIEVRDNGAGIAPENLTKIFGHGFTTKKDGHGFGLHSCALAARELGGSLRAESAGLDQGACFTLELPLGKA